MIIENEKELLKLLVMAKGFCEEQSCGLCHDALSRSEAIVIKQIITAAPVQQTTN